MLCDCLENFGIVNFEHFLCERGSEPCVKYHGIRSFEGIDFHFARCTLVEQALGRIESSEIVQHSRNARLAGIYAVMLRKQFGAPRDADRMFIAMSLSEVRAHALRQIMVAQWNQFRSLKCARRAAMRLRNISPRIFPAHITSALSLLSL